MEGGNSIPGPMSLMKDQALAKGTSAVCGGERFGGMFAERGIKGVDGISPGGRPFLGGGSMGPFKRGHFRLSQSRAAAENFP